MAESNWRPSATHEVLHQRAKLLAVIRRFFSERNVLEVDTPHLGRFANCDPAISSLQVHGAPSGYLQSSPEFPMKRLVAAGSGPIYQLAHVFRGDEQGKRHLPEFMMLEWYRPGWTTQQLMSEIEALLHECAQQISSGKITKQAEFQRSDYAECLSDLLRIDVLAASAEDIRSCCETLGLPVPERLDAESRSSRDFWLDWLMVSQIEPCLGTETPEFLMNYPASQAALSKICPEDPRRSLRFELFWQGVELANGFQELNDMDEQRQRFQADQSKRKNAGQPVPELDEAFLAAVDSLPETAGVALGVDRLLMLLLGITDIAEVVPFNDFSCNATALSQRDLN